MFPDPDPDEFSDPPSEEVVGAGSEGTTKAESRDGAGQPSAQSSYSHAIDPKLRGDIEEKTRTSFGLFGLGYFLWVVSKILALSQIDRLKEVDRLVFSPNRQQALFDDALDVLSIVGMLEIASALVLAGGVIYFFFQAYRNLERIGAREFRYPLSQTIWTWFVPFLNLFRPKQIANDIWRASTSFSPDRPGGWRDKPVTGAMLAWWIFWLAGSWLETRGFFYSLEEQSVSPDGQLTLIDIGLVAFGLQTIAAVFLIDFMIKVRDRQSKLVARFASSAPAVQESSQQQSDPEMAGPGPQGSHVEGQEGAKQVGSGSHAKEAAPPPPPAGWYDRQEGPGGRGYWDGLGWVAVEELECEACGANLNGPFCSECGAQEMARRRT